MSVSACLCPLCNQIANASDIDMGNRARVYCDQCSIYDITEGGLKEFVSSVGQARRDELAQLARDASSGSVLVIIKSANGGVHYEDKESKADRPAPHWLPEPAV